MSGIIAEIRSWPFLLAFGTLYLIVFLRAGGTYLIGRGVAAGAVRDRLDGPRLGQAMARVDRWGPLAVTASFFTVGVQTAVNAAAGLLKMPVPRYLLGLVPGAFVWAAVWSTIGMGAFLAAVRAGEGGRGAWLLVVLTVAVLIGLGVWLARRRVPRRGIPPAEEE